MTGIVQLREELFLQAEETAGVSGRDCDYSVIVRQRGWRIGQRSPRVCRNEVRPGFERELCGESIPRQLDVRANKRNRQRWVGEYLEEESFFV